jgi:hypothetical protein
MNAMTPQKPEPTNRLVKKALLRPAVEVDCTDWQTGEATAQWTTGRFVKQSLVRPAVEVDCSGWPECATVCLEMTLEPGATVDAVQLAFGLFDVLKAVNDLERALGGTGLTKVAAGQANGTVTLVLAPEQQTGAADRIRQLCERVNGVTEGTPKLPLPTVMKTIRARVA